MATLSRAPRSVPDLTAAISQAGVDPPPVPGAPCDMLRAAIVQRGGYCDWTVDHTGWVVTLHLPEEQVFFGSTLKDGLLSCLAWLVAAERQDALAHV